MGNAWKAQPSAALAELLARDGELDRILDGRGLRFERTPDPPAPAPPAPFRIPPADWDQERREREAREQAEHEARIREAAAALEDAGPPPRPTAPAKPKRAWRRSEAA